MQNAECKMKVSPKATISNHFRRKYHNYALCIMNYALLYRGFMNKTTIYALGYFDGVHLGHKALLDACREAAKDCQSGAVTFSGFSSPQVMCLKLEFIVTFPKFVLSWEGFGSI